MTALSPLSPLAPGKFPEIPAIAGVRLAVADAAVHYRGRTDLLLVELHSATTVAGVFTRSLTASAAVDWCREALAGGLARGLLVNSGNSNAFTGKRGVAAVGRTVQAAAGLLACPSGNVFVASTGVIGEPMADHKITDALPGMYAGLSDRGWEAAARAIMTTDTFPKGAAADTRIGGVAVTLGGIAKGSGMIAPDMATMLSFVFTDAAIAAPVLQELLNQGCAASFNCITVDSDTSTSDTLMLFATGRAGNAEITALDDPRLQDFRAALNALLVDLACQVVRDGEGAGKFITITVSGADSHRAARVVGLAIANSPLVKTAVAGADANWGRIVMAVGKSGERADRDRLAIRIGGILVAAEGMVVDGYDEAPVADHMKGLEIDIGVDLGLGDGRATVWTCDLTHGYIDINADYRS